MQDSERSLIAHLMRRAGFGVTRDELETYAAKGYEAVVEDLLQPERFPEVEEDVRLRYYGTVKEALSRVAEGWLLRMVNSQRPLQEKIALFFHHVFATGISKANHPQAMSDQIETLRRVGLSDLGTILVALSRDPAMIHWLDNNENHKDEPNENYGRELLELFSMGVGHYTEQDIKMAARAFTGWTFTQPIPVYPQGRYPSQFIYREEDHDDSVKTFLGESGPFNGEDIIDIIVKKEPAARFLCRHLYNFFVADEPQVPAWETVPPQDQEAIDTLVEAYFDSGAELRSILRVLFNSDFFKEARFKKVKSPAELVAGVIKLVGTYRFPDLGIERYVTATGLMGQELMNPPTVEGWHTGKEWVDGGTLNERVNFAVDEVADQSKPGVKAIVDALSAGESVPPLELVERCLDLVGPLEVGADTHAALVHSAETGGELRFGTEAEREESAERIGEMLQLVVASREYQFA